MLSIFAVNFRHILYSASIGPKIAHYSTFQKAIAFFFLIDPAYVETEKRQEQGQPISFAWFLAMSIPIYLAWVAEAVLGAMFGRLIPDPHAFGIDFLLPVYFLGLVMGFPQASQLAPGGAGQRLGVDSCPTSPSDHLGMSASAQLPALPLPR